MNNTILKKDKQGKYPIRNQEGREIGYIEHIYGMYWVWNYGKHGSRKTLYAMVGTFAAAKLEAERMPTYK